MTYSTKKWIYKRVITHLIYFHFNLTISSLAPSHFLKNIFLFWVISFHYLKYVASFPYTELLLLFEQKMISPDIWNVFSLGSFMSSTSFNWFPLMSSRLSPTKSSQKNISFHSSSFEMSLSILLFSNCPLDDLSDRDETDLLKRLRTSFWSDISLDLGNFGSTLFLQMFNSPRDELLTLRYLNLLIFLTPRFFQTLSVKVRLVIGEKTNETAEIGSRISTPSLMQRLVTLVG